MSDETRSLLRSAQPAIDGAAAQCARRLLTDPGAHLAAPGPSSEKVDQLLPTLRARLANAERSGTDIVGLADVITRLELLEPGARVLGYGVVSEVGAGNVYFTEAGHRPVGVMLVER